MPAPSVAWLGVCFALLCTLACQPSARAQENCETVTLFSLADVVRPCCEAMPSGDCSGGFPSACSVTCATELAPMWQLCGEMAQDLPDDMFPDFSLAACAGPRLPHPT